MQESAEEREFAQQKSSIVHTKITQEYLENDFDRYVGPKVKELLGKTTLKQMKTFDSKIGEIKGAYFVKASKSLLKKFQAYFIAKCAPKAYSYSTFMLKDFLSGLANNVGDELFVAGTGKDVLFLYLHGELSGIGNTDNWVSTTTVDVAANRTRKNLITVVLSERDLPTMENSKEFKVISLGGAEKAKEIVEVIEGIKSTEVKQGISATDYS